MALFETVEANTFEQTLPPGADTTRDVQQVERRYTPVFQSGITAGAQLVPAGTSGILTLRALGGTLGAITIYDGTSTSDPVMVPAHTPVQGQVICEDLIFNNGVFIVQVAATVTAGGYR